MNSSEPPKIIDQIKDRLAKHSRPALCFAADCDEYSLKLVLDHRGDEISIIKVHPEIMDDDVLYHIKLRAKVKPYLLWADQKISDVPHIASQQLEAVAWADIVTVMAFAWCDELQLKAAELGIAILLVNELNTNGKLLWKHEEPVVITPNVLGTVGSRIEGLLHVRAGVSATLHDTESDIIVRGRSLYNQSS